MLREHRFGLAAGPTSAWQSEQCPACKGTVVVETVRADHKADRDVLDGGNCPLCGEATTFTVQGVLRGVHVASGPACSVSLALAR